MPVMLQVEKEHENSGHHRRLMELQFTCVSYFCIQYTVMVTISSGIFHVWINFYYDGCQVGCLIDRGMA